MNFKREVSDTLETKAYELSEKEKVQVIKQMVGLAGPAANSNIYPGREREMQDCKGYICSAVQ